MLIAKDAVPEVLTAQLTPEVFWRVLSTGCIRPPFLEVIRMDRALPPDEFCKRRTIYGTFLHPIIERLKNVLASGYTIRIRYANLFFLELGLLLSDESTSYLADLLSLLGTGDLRVNLYVANAFSRAVSLHSDRRNTLVAGIWGEKDWSLSSGWCPPGTPFTGYIPDLRTLTLGSGDVVFIPEGRLHAVLPRSFSAHATFTRSSTRNVSEPSACHFAVWKTLASIIHASQSNLQMSTSSTTSPLSGFDDISLITIDEWIECLRLLDLRAGDLAVLRGGTFVKQDWSVTRTIEHTLKIRDAVNWEVVLQQLAYGATLVVGGVQRWLPLLANPRILGVSLYLGQSSASGGDMHVDTADVLVFQLSGEKIWYIGSDSQEVTLHAGEMLRLPFGTPHRASSGKIGSVHLSVLQKIPSGTR
jgi:mannose-6-phosphate isomerase-like protein (cupin superfamily)